MSAALLERSARRVVVSVDPKAGESLAGYLCRVAGENVISGPRRLLPPGTTWPPNDLTPEELSRLAIELGCGAGAVQRLFARSHGDPLGPRLRLWTRRRVSPASLKRAAYHRAHWQVRPLPFCPETWGAVIEECPECRATLTWRTNAVDRCQRCGLDLKWAEASFAPEEDREELGLISRLITDGTAEPIRPEWVNFLTARELFELIVLIGRALRPERDLSPEGEARRLIIGLRTLLGAPGSIETLAKLDRNEPEDPFVSRMRATAAIRKGPVGDAILLLLKPRPDDPGLPRLKRAREARGLKTATEVAAELQIERSQLRRLLDGGVLGDRSWRGSERAYDWFSREDLARLQEVVRGRVSAWTWGRRMGLGGVDVRQLVAERLIDPWGQDRLHDVFGGLQLDARRAAELERSIKLYCEEARVTNSWIPISRVLVGVGGGYKPWALLLKTAMRGNLVHGLGRKPVKDIQIGRLLVHPDDAAWIRGRIAGEAPFPAFEPRRLGAYRPDRLSWGEVETLLNCNPADVARLLELGHIRRAAGDPGDGFDAPSVELFSSSAVSSLEIAALVGRTARSAVLGLARGGWPRPRSGFWPREALPEIIDSLRPKPWGEREEASSIPPARPHRGDRTRGQVEDGLGLGLCQLWAHSAPPGAISTMQ